jgi:hypothetical protein
MFAPFVAFIDKWNKGAALMVLQATFLYALGPGMAAVVTPNLHEQASIWCLFSMAQAPAPLHPASILMLCTRTSPRPQIFVMFFVIYGSFNKDKVQATDLVEDKVQTREQRKRNKD